MVYNILLQPDTKFMQQIPVLKDAKTNLLPDLDKYCHLLNSERSLLIKAFINCVHKNLKEQPNMNHFPLLINSLFQLARKTKKIFLDLSIGCIPENYNLHPYMDTIMKHCTSKYKQQLELLTHFMNNHVMEEIKAKTKLNHRTLQGTLISEYVKKCIVHSDPLMRTLGKDLFCLLSQQEQTILENQLGNLEKKRLNILVKPTKRITESFKSSDRLSHPSREKEINNLLYLLDTNQRIKTIDTLNKLPYDNLSKDLLVKLYQKLVLVRNIAPTLQKIEDKLSISECVDILVREKRWMRLKYVIKWEMVTLEMVSCWDPLVFQYVNYSKASIEIKNHINNLLGKEDDSTSIEISLPKRTAPFTPKKSLEVKRLRTLSDDDEDSGNEEIEFSKPFNKMDSKIDLQNETTTAKSNDRTGDDAKIVASESKYESNQNEASFVTPIKDNTADVEETSLILSQLKVDDNEYLENTPCTPLVKNIEEKFDNLMSPTRSKIFTPSKTPIMSRRKEAQTTPLYSPMILDTPFSTKEFRSFSDHVDMYLSQGNLCQFYVMLFQNSTPFSKFDYMDYFSEDPRSLHAGCLLDTIINLVDTDYLGISISMLTWTIKKMETLSETLTLGILSNSMLIFDHLVEFIYLGFCQKSTRYSPTSRGVAQGYWEIY
eukprot:NODE_5_length_72347_cov_1.339331.p10 type:complete len:657 gc:universal NODE_5_length_72347_cov_1.339331:47958-45988(-)